MCVCAGVPMKRMVAGVAMGLILLVCTAMVASLPWSPCTVNFAVTLSSPVVLVIPAHAFGFCQA